MPTAKSYQTLKIVSGPFSENNRQYVIVKTKSGKDKKVRWYTDLEYAKMYPNEEPAAAGGTDRPWWGPQKDVLGFQEGYIWILQDPNEEAEEWLLLNGHPHSTRFWDRYVKSTEPIDLSDLPFHIKLVKLFWDDVGEDDGYLKSDLEVAQAVDAARYGKIESNWAGQVGDRIDRELSVLKKAKKETPWGTQVDHIFQDAEGNRYQWITSAKDLELGATYQVKGSVKELTTQKGQKITVLTRCRSEWKQTK